MATGFPSRVPGVKRQCRTAFSAARSRLVWPELRTSVIFSGRPDTLTNTRSSTVPSSPSQRADWGYSGAGLWA